METTKRDSVALDDKDEFEEDFLVSSLREFMFQPIDEKLRLAIVQKLKNDNYAVTDVRFDGYNIELDLLDIHDKPFTVKMGDIRNL